MNDHIVALRSAIEQELNSLDLPTRPAHLYDPIRYILSLGGKRVRPVLALLSAELFTESHAVAMNQAIAIEVFHNFTLLHDDIMDKADFRRGVDTVHRRWNPNTALLSGDGMLVYAYQLLHRCPDDKLRQVSEIFSSTALLVCEGQQLDMDLASGRDVTMEEYLHMIRLKTAELLAGSMQIGGVMAGAKEGELELLRTFAVNMGLAFQIQDDYLDAFGNPDQFGKTKGGDILEGKRTWLTIKSLQLANEFQQRDMTEALSSQSADRLDRVMELYGDLNIAGLAEEEVERHSSSALEALTKINGRAQAKQNLRDLVDYLIDRAV